MIRPRPLSVAEVAAALQASDSYVRKLLISQRLYGIKVGSVWAVYEEDLETFRRLRRPRGRPRNGTAPVEPDIRIRITSEQAPAGKNDGHDLVGRRRPNSARSARSSRRQVGDLDIS
jgi:excisionase family DNA binding protein